MFLSINTGSTLALNLAGLVGKANAGARADGGSTPGPGGMLTVRRYTVRGNQGASAEIMAPFSFFFSETAEASRTLRGVPGWAMVEFRSGCWTVIRKILYRPRYKKKVKKESRIYAEIWQIY